MAENIIFYGPPGTGKTYLLQSIMNDYIDYDIADAQLRSAYTMESKDWILITMVLLQNQGKMPTKDIQTKVDSLGLGVTINVAAVLDKHNIEQPPIPGVTREQPRIFFTTNPGEWYVDLIRVQQARADFFKKFLSSAGLRVLFILVKKTKMLKATITLKHLEKNVYEVLKISGFTSFLKIVD